ncbi:MAG: transcriptional coactivator p15/PC4 family protein [Syntrophorhabdales bacterium]|jgi:hypothetical protein
MLICEVEKNMKERIRVSIEEYHGHRFIDCRVYYEDAQGELKPTKKGIALNADTIDEVIEALKKGSAALEDQLSPRAEDRKAKPAQRAEAKEMKPTAAPKADGRNISDRVRAWVFSVNGDSQFQSKQCQLTLGLTEPKQAHLVNVVFSKLCDEGAIERTGQGRGSYRRRNADQQ